MQSRWSDAEAQDYIAGAKAAGLPAALGLRIYTSRLIGQDPDLVLHGGGNTSVKIDGREGRVIHVKGSGWDLGQIEAPGLPAMYLEPLLHARQIERMSDPDMVAFLRANLLDPAAPTPSVEALLHAYMPFNFVDHTHATAILVLADQDGMAETIEQLYGGRVAFVPYVMPGYDLGQASDRIFQARPEVEGLWLEKHGLFTFADDARVSYELMIEFVTMAEEHIRHLGVNVASGPEANETDGNDPAFHQLLQSCLKAQGYLGEEPAVTFWSTPSLRALLARPDLDALLRRGTATPDHVIRIKPFPLILPATASRSQVETALAAYAARYLAYFQRNAAFARERKVMLDPAPRAVFVPGRGIYALGANAKAAAIVGDLWEQSARIILAAEAIGHYSPIREAELFEMEYWSLEQAKLKKL